MASTFHSEPVVNPEDHRTQDLPLPPAVAAYVPPPRVSTPQLQARFAGLLGYHPTLPAKEWRAVGDPEVLAQTVRSTVEWMNAAVVFRMEVPEMPNIHHVPGPGGELVPAPGTRSVFDACLDGFNGGLTPAGVKSAWDAAMRDVLRSTAGAPGYRGSR